MITHPKGEIELSQSVKAYRASIVLSGDIPAGRWTSISTDAAVLSSIFFTFILPLSFAFEYFQSNQL